MYSTAILPSLKAKLLITISCKLGLSIESNQKPVAGQRSTLNKNHMTLMNLKSEPMIWFCDTTVLVSG